MAPGPLAEQKPAAWRMLHILAVSLPASYSLNSSIGNLKSLHVHREGFYDVCSSEVEQTRLSVDDLEFISERNAGIVWKESVPVEDMNNRGAK